LPEIQVKDKLITLEELGTAYNNITPANIGAVSTSAVIDVPHGGTGATTAAQARANLDVPSTTGSGASGTWNINIPFSGDATGFKNFSLNAIDIDNTRGNWEAGFSERTNHGTFPAWDGWCHVAQYDCDHFLYQVANSVTSGSSKVYSLSVRSRWLEESWGLWTDIFYTNGAVPVASGGTGANSAATARANLGLNDIGIAPAQSAISPNSDNQMHQITINKDCWVCASFHVAANTDGTVILTRNSIPVINNGNTNGACNYWANAQFPCKAGGLLHYKLSSNATDSSIYFLTV
jgi:hypothetical protein